MKYIDSLREGMRISEVYLCKSKQIAVTKTGKEYGRLMLQDKTGIVDAKIWNLNSPGVGTFVSGFLFHFLYCLSPGISLTSLYFFEQYVPVCLVLL